VRARALSTDDVNELGRRTGQRERLRTITPHRLFLSMIAGLAGGQVESLADRLREFNHHNDVTVAYKAFYNRLARPGFATFMHRCLTGSSSACAFRRWRQRAEQPSRSSRTS
jgi:hypothetical protein